MLPVPLEVPRDENGWNVWSFNHRDSCQRIRAAIIAKGGPPLVDYELFPAPQKDIKGWLQRLSQTHIDFNAVLGLQSSDLLDVNLTDDKQKEAWVNLVHQENFDAEQALGL